MRARRLIAVKIDDYRRFTEVLTARLSADPDVLAVVAVGSMAEVEPNIPDESSGHDFWVVTRPGAQERFRDRKRWLPDPGRILLFFRETPHGVKALYEDGHLIAFAVFDSDELWLGKLNQYRVLFDRADYAAPLEGIKARSLRAAAEQGSDDAWLIGQLFSSLIVGVGRARRGELLSAHQHVRAEAVSLLTELAARHGLAGRSDLRDPLDLYRRFERRFPELGRRLAEGLQAPIEVGAQVILNIAGEILKSRGDLWPEEAAAAVLAYLQRDA